jgi:hypothetical protein
MRSSRSERLASGNEYSSHSVQDFTLAAEPDRGEVMALIASRLFEPLWAGLSFVRWAAVCDL